MNTRRPKGQKGTRRPENKLFLIYRAESGPYPARFAYTLSISFAPSSSRTFLHRSAFLLQHNHYANILRFSTSLVYRPLRCEQAPGDE